MAAGTKATVEQGMTLLNQLRLSSTTGAGVGTVGTGYGVGAAVTTSLQRQSAEGNQNKGEIFQGKSPVHQSLQNATANRLILLCFWRSNRLRRQLRSRTGRPFLGLALSLELSAATAFAVL